MHRRNNASKLKTAYTLTLALALSFASLPTSGTDWSFNGFGTLGAIGTDADNIGFRRDYSQSAAATSAWRADVDSRLGLQLDAHFNNEFYAAVQWTARNQAGNFFEQNLDWAYLRWKPSNGLDLRLGRLVFDAFLMSDYRNVGYAYLWMRPPVEFYSYLIPYHLDGMDVVKKFNVADGYLSLKGYAGYNLTDVQQAYGSPIIGTEWFLFGGNLVYETGNWLARLSYAQGRPLNRDLNRGWPQ